MYLNLNQEKKQEITAQQYIATWMTHLDTKHLSHDHNTGGTATCPVLKTIQPTLFDMTNGQVQLVRQEQIRFESLDGALLTAALRNQQLDEGPF